MCAAFCLAGVVFGQNSDDTAKSQNGSRIIEPLTHEKLSELAKKTGNPIDQLKKVEVKEASTAAKPEKPKSLLEHCHMLHRGEMVTLVPKQAVLHMPDSLRGTIVTTKPEGTKFVIWSDFFSNNRGWIRVREVTRDQAEGKEAFPEEFTASLKDVGQVIVATYQGSPIDVLPVKEEKPAEEEGAGDDNTDTQKP